MPRSRSRSGESRARGVVSRDIWASRASCQHQEIERHPSRAGSARGCRRERRNSLEGAAASSCRRRARPPRLLFGQLLGPSLPSPACSLSPAALIRLLLDPYLPAAPRPAPRPAPAASSHSQTRSSHTQAHPPPPSSPPPPMHHSGEVEILLLGRLAVAVLSAEQPCGWLEMLQDAQMHECRNRLRSTLPLCSTRNSALALHCALTTPRISIYQTHMCRLS